jgi:hypothetical protein
VVKSETIAVTLSPEPIPVDVIAELAPVLAAVELLDTLELMRADPVIEGGVH